MPRGRHVGLIRRDADVYEAVRNLAEYRITAIRRRGAAGEITEVKHIRYGWISAAKFNDLRTIAQMQPVLLEIIKGGYMLKAAVWTISVDVEILASGVSIPLGVVLVVAAVACSAADQAAGNKAYALLDLAALALPFGEIWLLWRARALFFSSPTQVADELLTLTSPLYDLLKAGSKAATPSYEEIRKAQDAGQHEGALPPV